MFWWAYTNEKQNLPRKYDYANYSSELRISAVHVGFLEKWFDDVFNLIWSFIRKETVLKEN